MPIANDLPEVLETTEPERLATGFIFTEGPLWHPDGYWYFVDLRRNQLLRLTPAAAEDHYQRALGWARRQGALSWELRAATSLARLLREQNRPTEAIALLAPIYNRFTEGFDTADLKAAKALIDNFSKSKGASRSPSMVIPLKARRSSS
jgi:hypothetical protein